MQRIARTVFNAPRLSARAQASQRAFSSEVKPGEAKKDNKESSTLSKPELLKAVAENSGVSQVNVEKVLNSLTEVVVGTLKTEKRVALKGLGFFELRFKRAREARNPRTQEPLMIPDKHLPAFTPTRAFKNRFATK